MTSLVTRRRWAIELEATARAYWTPERTAAATGGKDLLIRPGEAALLLRALGLLNGDASLPPNQHRKYLQINHMVGVLEPAFAALRARHGRLRLLDAGCGRSYLTLLLAWCARHVWGHPLEVLGVDRNPAVIAECRRRTELAGLDDVVRFEATALDQLDAGAAWARGFGAAPPAGEPIVHGVIALHACDTATCDALALGVGLGAELLAVAPCCQAELARGWAALADGDGDGPFAPVWRMPHLRRETAAHVTDAMRTLLLRAAGYQVTAMEFVPAEHTRKNTLIRAVRSEAPDAAARAQYVELTRATGGVGLGLAARLGVLALVVAAVAGCGKGGGERKPAGEGSAAPAAEVVTDVVTTLPPVAGETVGPSGDVRVVAAADDGAWILTCASTGGRDSPRLVVGAGDGLPIDRLIAASDRDLVFVEGGALVHVDVVARTRRVLGPPAHAAIDPASRRIVHLRAGKLVVRDPGVPARELPAPADAVAVWARGKRWVEVGSGQPARDLGHRDCAPIQRYPYAFAPTATVDLDPTGVEALDRVGPQLGITAAGEVTLDGEVVLAADCAGQVHAALAEPPRLLARCAGSYRLVVAGPGGFTKDVPGHIERRGELAAIADYLVLGRRLVCWMSACIDLVAGVGYPVEQNDLVWIGETRFVAKRGAGLVIQAVERAPVEVALPRITQEVTVDTATGRRRTGPPPPTPAYVDAAGRFLLYGRYLIDLDAGTLRATLGTDAAAVDVTGRVLVPASPGQGPYRWIHPS